MDTRMTQRIKKLARDLGADLIGFAPICRFDEAPIKMSPQGIMPSAKTVIVCAIHHPDATMELEGGEHGKSQVFESYAVQYTMNTKLDHISFEIAHYLDNNGYNAVPIVSSNIWRYRSYKELDAVFSPDMSHIYASVCAGLSEMGWNGLALTPEYGPRNRFVSIITDAELEPTPLLPGGTLCDMCGECIRCCPTDAYRKEVKGVKELNIRDADGRVYHHKFANKNLWRCAWGEHFDLDLDDVIPDVVTEKEIIQREAEKGRRHGEMGVCLKVCVPKALRFRDESYAPYNRRRRLIADPSLAVSREVYDMMSEVALKYHVERITIVSAEKMKEQGYDLSAKMPGTKNVIFLSAKSYAATASAPEELKWKMKAPVNTALSLGLGYANYDVARIIEKLGYSVMPNMSSCASYLEKFVSFDLAEGETVSRMAVITDAPLEERDWFLEGYEPETTAEDLKAQLAEIVGTYCADMMGVAPVSRINAIVDQLKPVKDGEQLFSVRDKNPAFRVFDPVVTETARRLYRPEDYLPGAKNVLVIGMSYPAAAAFRAGREPAEAVGPFIFAQSQAQNELSFVGLEAVKTLRRAGYNAVLTRDLIGMGSPICSPRGEYSSPFDCAFEAAAAGLGDVTYSGTLNTEKYGINQKFICVVTDAPLAADEMKPNAVQTKCADCKKCFALCPMTAFEEANEITLNVEGVSFRYIPVNTARCQWASRYVLTNRDGDDCLGSKLDLMPNGKISAEQLASGLVQRDPITKGRPGNAEHCVIECPLAGEDK